MMKAYLILEDGSVFEGKVIGAVKEVVSEFVFNTSMTGYLEVLTDPSYAGPVSRNDLSINWELWGLFRNEESSKPHVEGFIVNELAKTGK